MRYAHIIQRDCRISKCHCPSVSLVSRAITAVQRGRIGCGVAHHTPSSVETLMVWTVVIAR